MLWELGVLDLCDCCLVQVCEVDFAEGIRAFGTGLSKLTAVLKLE